MNTSSKKTNQDKKATNLSLPKLFSQQVEKTPDAIAVRYHDRSVTYAALYQQATGLSEIISSRFPSDPIIGVSTTRNLEMVVGVIAVIVSGRSYLPLDPAYPEERLKQIIEDSKVSACLCADNDKNLFSSLGLTIIPIDKQPEASISRKTAIQEYSPGYILYTSGSTGKPKGVCMGQAPLVNLLQWQEKNSSATTGTNTLQFAPLSFDVSFQEIFATLTTGGTLVLIDDDLRLDPFRLLHFIKEAEINRIFLPFVALQQLAEIADANTVFPACLTEVMTAGEQLKITPQLVQLFSQIKNSVLFNQYGPTEAHVVTQLILKGNPTEWPALPSIGTAIDNTEMLIIDEDLKLLPHGETGELVISGVCLADGYLNRPDLTAEKFIEWQHPEKGKVRIYRTGDLARFMPDGNIEFLGRKDHQVKIRGHRVELGEVEVALSKIDGVQQVAVVAREDIPGQKRLVAYLTVASAKTTTAFIRQQLQQRLPDYMMPSAFMIVEDFPKTSSGKIDRKVLPVPEIQRPDLATMYKAPSSQKEKQLAALWRELLQLDKVGINDNFFDLGGNSLLAVKTVVRLRQDHQYELPVTKLYQFPTVKGIVGYLDRAGEVIKKKTADKTRKASPDVAVIAMAGRFPGANNIQELWSLLSEGRETTHFFTEEELDPSISQKARKDPNYVKARGIIDGADQFDPAFFNINPKVAELMDPQQRIFLEISYEVLESSGYLPEKHEGTIGVFAGCGNNTYYLNNVLSNKELIERVGGFQVMTVNEKDYIATRTAYELNLKGPAVSVHTGCSTSLLAIAEAVENIRNGRCNMAIAGGVAITAPIRSGQFYEEGAMFSRDGHCRPFDKDAQGTVFSDGAGVVLLKNLEEAIGDGDTIYAVVKGFGYNNDGGGKGSFTAPSAEGQAGAIAQAIEDAGIEPSAIGYVEAHGTATPLGDPIEIEGLKLAFGDQSQKQYCAIGSIKSNMGHLTAAAGVAGFIKTTLALYHKQLPASLHFTSPNPNINFGDSPFYVNASLQKWEAEKRIAGVSSFGVGGTNVHVILEGFENKKKTEVAPKPYQLITWSAKTDVSRDNYTTALASYLEKNADLNTAALAYTLQTTRRNFNYRRFLVCSGADDLRSKLTAGTPAPSEIKKLDEEDDEIVFVFPGQGSQYNNMGLDLYEQEPAFKQAADECAEILKDLIGEDIRKIIFSKDAADVRINDTKYTQPALFTVEYAMAKLWMSWGIQPSAMAGHSIGEYVAAHLSGVFSLKDALTLLSARARLMGSMPAGKMLSVQTDEETLKSLLPATLSIAAINTSKLYVVAGRNEDIDTFSLLLKEKGITGRVLKTSHAFHSVMMEPVLEPFLEIAKTIRFGKPLIPIVSTLTGNWISEAEITDPAYWPKQLRGTVRFADALEMLCQDRKRLLLEVGPGTIAANLAKHQLASKGIVSVQGFEKGAEGESEYYSVLRSLGQLWLNGISPDWKQLYGAIPATIDSLPAYAFNRKKLWVEPIPSSPVRTTERPAAVELSSMVVSAQPVSSKRSTESIAAEIRKILEQASDIQAESVAGDASFIALGFDSLLLTQLAFTFKKTFDVPVSFRQLNEDYNTIDLLAGYLQSRLPEQSIIETISPEITPAITVTDSLNRDDLLIRVAQQLENLTKQVSLLQQKVAAGSIETAPANTSLSNGYTTIAQQNRPFIQSPVEGARLGKDAEGNPAWFVPDESRPGKYLQVEFYES